MLDAGVFGGDLQVSRFESCAVPGSGGEPFFTRLRVPSVLGARGRVFCSCLCLFLGLGQQTQSSGAATSKSAPIP